MFEVGFTEILVISVLALVVLGPEKLPRVAAQIGKWVGRARTMARQFREQLEDEVQLAETNKAKAKESARAEQDAASAQAGAAPPSTPGAETPPPGADASTQSSTQNMYSGVVGEHESHSAPVSPEASAGAPVAASETAHSDQSGPPPEPEASVYQPPRYAHAGGEDTYHAPAPAETNGTAEPTSSSAHPSQPSSPSVETQPQSHQNDDDPPPKPGDFIIHTHERGI